MSGVRVPAAGGASLPRRTDDLGWSLVARFEEQVARHPQRLAVKAGPVQVSYTALNQQADRIAGALSAGGIGSAQVATLMDRDANLVAAGLGVLKAGNTWIPLDPSYPAARNQYVLEDSLSTVLLTDRKHADAAAALAGSAASVWWVDQMASEPAEHAGPQASGHALACILYTSGSTGHPRGVMLDHRGLVHLVERYAKAIGVRPEDRFSQLASCSHVGGLGNLLRAILTGAAVFPLDPRESEPAELARWLEREGITVCQMVPAVLRQVLQYLPPNLAFPELRLVHVSGESLTRRDVDLFRERFPARCVLLNNFGCTEMSSFRQFFVTLDTEIVSDMVPIGYPVDDADVLLLDSPSEVATAGQRGEIAVRSRYLAVGYWREPALTAERFTPAPGGVGDRMYRTGDVGQVLPDGCLLHLGRNDQQVQIRGFRVETAEVEAAIMGTGLVQACAVWVAENPRGETQLVAYVVPTRAERTTSGRLRALMRSRLPAHMWPTTFAFLELLPSLPGGKLDRLALPPPDWSAVASGEPFTGPRTETERGVAAIWSEVLGIAQIDVQDDFFDLGGHSILATRVAARLRQVFAVELSARDLFDAPTVAELARAVDLAVGAAAAGQ